MKPRFQEVCELEADLSGLRRSLIPQRNSITGTTYYTVKFTVAVLFGGTTLKAHLRWLEDVSVELNQTHEHLTEIIDIRVNYVRVRSQSFPTP
jgi:hypothetical protein